MNEDSQSNEQPAQPEKPGSTIALPSLTEQPGDRIGRYKLLQQIGEGGCGVVYMAEQTEPVKRKVALKVIKLGMDTKQVVARFEAERQALAIMDHPNIAKVLDGGATENGRPFFVMEFVPGIKITDYCDRKKLSTRERLELFIKVCHAIQHAHQKGIIHRDIKPSNVMVTQDMANEPLPKVIDFGIAKATAGQPLTDKTLFTAVEQFIGTPAYMSPEQADLTGLDIDTRSDIYSLGVLLYELLTGRTPFDTEELLKGGLDTLRHTLRDKEATTPSMRVAAEFTVAHKKSTARGEKDRSSAREGTREVAPAPGVLRPEPELSSAPEEQRRLGAAHSKRAASPAALDTHDAATAHRLAHAKELIRELRGDLDWIVLKCLEKDRTRRYETANGIAMDLQRHLNNEPVVARPPSQLYRFGKMVRRNKVAFTAVNAVALAIAIGFGVSTRLYLKEKSALQRAVEAEREQIKLREQADAARATETSLRKEAETARVNEAAQRQKAEANAQNAQNVAGFLKSMIEGARPNSAKGRDTTLLLEILDKTAKRIDTELKDQPVVAAELCVTLANTYHTLGDDAKAEPLARQAVQLQKSVSDKPSVAIYEALQALRYPLSRNQKFEEAEAVAREMLEVARIIPGDQSERFCGALHSLGFTKAGLGDYAGAEALFQQELTLTSPDDTPQRRNARGYALSGLVQTCERQGDVAGAEDFARQALALRRTQHGEEHTVVAERLHALAEVLRKRGDLVGAENAFRECLAIRVKLLGDFHPSTIGTQNALAGVLTARGDTQGLEDALRQVLAGQRERKSSDPAKLEAALSKLAFLLRSQRKFDEAEPLLRELLKSRSGHLPPDDAKVLAATADLAGTLAERALQLRQSAPEKAASLKREADQLVEKISSVSDAGSATWASTAAELLARRGIFQAATPHLARAVELNPTNTFGFLKLAPLLVETGDVDAYRELCRTAMEQHGLISDPTSANYIAKACLILPSSRAGLSAVDRLTVTAVSIPASDVNLPWRQFSRALSQYRQGKSAEAIDWSDKSLASSKIQPACAASAHAVQAMARSGPNQTPARESLAKAAALVEANWLGPARDDLGPSWHDWLIARLLLRQAQALIESPPTEEKP